MSVEQEHPSMYRWFVFSGTLTFQDDELEPLRVLRGVHIRRDELSDGIEGKWEAAERLRRSYAEQLGAVCQYIESRVDEEDWTQSSLTKRVP